MQRIIYSSQATTDFSPEALIELLADARSRNQAVRLTGMLLYASQSFLQVLEGEPDALSETYSRITADPRHTNLRLLLNAPIDTRLFPDWTMGFEHIDDEELAERLDGYVPEMEYPLVNPALVSNGRVAERLLTLYAHNRVA